MEYSGKFLLTLEHSIRIVTEKPEKINYVPGQAVDISINKKGWEEKLRVFTFTSIPENDIIEFTIKTYPSWCNRAIAGINIGR